MDAQALKAMEQIKKLLALANNNDNEHQAAAAMAKANEIMERYNLDLATVGQEKAPSSDRSDNKRKGGLYAWQRELWETVAKLNFCMYWSSKGLQKGQSYEHRILGRQVNVISTEIMAEYLQQTIERLTQAHAKQHGYNVFAREMIAHREGMSLRIRERLEKLRREREEAAKKAKAEEEARQRHPAYAGTGTGLILADVIASEEDLNNDYLQGLEPGTTARRRAEAKARDAAILAEHERRLREDPEYLARHEAQQQRNKDWWANWEAEREVERQKEEKRREKRKGKPGYDEDGYKIEEPRQYRERAQTSREKRMDTTEFYDGYQKGDTVSLNQQVDAEERKAIDG